MRKANSQRWKTLNPVSVCRYGEFSVLLGFCNCAVEDDGTIRAISKLNVVQMVAELESRGINCEGLNRADLMNEVRVRGIFCYTF